jgi:hypothetical protein
MACGLGSCRRWMYNTSLHCDSRKREWRMDCVHWFSKSICIIGHLSCSSKLGTRKKITLPFKHIYYRKLTINVFFSKHHSILMLCTSTLWSTDSHSPIRIAYQLSGCAVISSTSWPTTPCKSVLLKALFWVTRVYFPYLSLSSSLSCSILTYAVWSRSQSEWSVSQSLPWIVEWSCVCTLKKVRLGTYRRRA